MSRFPLGFLLPIARAVAHIGLGAALVCASGILLGACLLSVTGCSKEQAGSPEQREFAQRYQAAHQAEDIEAMLALYHWDGVEDGHRFFVRQAILHEFEYPILDLRFAPLEPGDAYHYTYAGQEYQPSLEPVCRVEIAWASPERMHASSLLGRHAGRLYFVNPVAVPLTEERPLADPELPLSPDASAGSMTGGEDPLQKSDNP